MSSQYPTTLDNFATNKTNATLTESDHPNHHNDLADAINKIENELGVNPSGGFATVAARLATGVSSVTNALNEGFSASNNGIQNRDALITMINNMPSSGGVIYIPRGLYALDCSITPVVTGDKAVTIVGDRRLTVLSCSNAGTTAFLRMFNLSSGAGRIELEDLTILGPTLGSGGNFDVVYANGSGGAIRAMNCVFNDFNSALRVSSAVNWLGTIDAHYCEFDGYGNANLSTPIMCNSVGVGQRGKKVSVSHSVFKNFGSTAGGLAHGIYVYTDWDVECAFNNFVNGVGTGVCVHIYDEGIDTVNASRHQIIFGNKFGEGLTSIGGVVAARGARPLISSNTFECNGYWIIFDDGGIGDVINNKFAGTLTAAAGIQISDNTILTGRFIGNRFLATTGSAPSIHIFGLGNYIIESNFFQPSSASSCAVRIEHNSVITYNRNLFTGTYTEAAVRILNNSTNVFDSNRFAPTGTGIVNESTASTIAIFNNFFSTGNGLTLTATPTNPIQISGNYGSGTPNFIPTVASATIITLPAKTNLVNISGSTTINTINPLPAGTVTTLKFVASCVVNDGSNLRLNGTFIADADDTLILVSDGTNWYEVSRSAN